MKKGPNRIKRGQKQGSIVAKVPYHLSVLSCTPHPPMTGIYKLIASHSFQVINILRSCFKCLQVSHAIVLCFLKVVCVLFRYISVCMLTHIWEDHPEWKGKRTVLIWASSQEVLRDRWRQHLYISHVMCDILQA